MPAELRSEQAGRVTAFHAPQTEVGDVITVPNAGDWRIKSKRVVLPQRQSDSTLSSLQAP